MDHPLGKRVYVRDAWCLENKSYLFPKDLPIYGCEACHRGYGWPKPSVDGAAEMVVELGYCFEGQHCITAPRGVDLRLGARHDDVPDSESSDSPPSLAHSGFGSDNEGDDDVLIQGMPGFEDFEESDSDVDDNMLIQDMPDSEDFEESDSKKFALSFSVSNTRAIALLINLCVCVIWVSWVS